MVMDFYTFFFFYLKKHLSSKHEEIESENISLFQGKCEQNATENAT